MSEIRNKVAESGLISLDLADYKPTNEIVGIDIADQLWQGLVVKEKDFRDWIRSNDWSIFQDKAVFIHCSADAIVPTWAFMLIGSKLEGIAHSYLIGSKEEIQKRLIIEKIQNQSLLPFQDGKVIVKGCSNIPFPDFSMVELLKHIQPVVKSVMYGEPCSTVPIYKRG